MYMPSALFPPRNDIAITLNLFLDKHFAVIFNVHIMKLFETFFYYFFFRSLHPGIALR